ncbi:MAG: prolipoprotein diacylglyceryl transferase [Candidatus Hydrogenedentales bacterium]
MRPELFTLFGITFFAYRTMLAVAFVVGTLLAARESRRRAGGVELSPMFGVWALVGALAGARMFYVVQYEGVAKLWRAAFLWESGLVFYGGLLGGLVAVSLYLCWNRAPLLASFDLMAPFLALGEAITRVGCFLNGCCFGEPSNLPWAVQFPAQGFAFIAQREAGLINARAAASIPVHPTQLYMTLGLVAVFGVLIYCRRRKSWDGSVFVLYLLLYGCLRFLVEILRGDSVRSVLGVTVSQAISLCLVLFAGALLVVRRKRNVRP